MKLDSKKRQLVQKIRQLRKNAEAKGLSHGQIRNILQSSSNRSYDNTEALDIHFESGCNGAATENSGFGQSAEKNVNSATNGAATKTSGFGKAKEKNVKYASDGAACETLGVGKHAQKKRMFMLAFCLGTLLAFFCYRYNDFFLQFMAKTKSTKCIFEYNDYTKEMTRPVANCDFCRNLTEIPVEENISSSRFIERYAYSLVPAHIKGETKNWTAVNNFDFYFLKDMLNRTEGAFRAILHQCQFHPYKTEFTSLEDVFNMADDRATGKDAANPWYIAWSNCHPGLRHELRKHFHIPSFLPQGSETSLIDWMFLGTTGQGAATHIDYIQKPSWQAQLSGRKTWTLIPPPECDSQCKTLRVTLDKGDILIVDTNLWYHSTFVEPGGISIAVGSEYD